MFLILFWMILCGFFSTGAHSETGCPLCVCVCACVRACAHPTSSCSMADPRQLQDKILKGPSLLGLSHSKAPPIAETAPESEALGVAGHIKQMGYRTGTGWGT